MKRVSLSPRPDWQDKAEAAGFRFHTMYGEPYWDETSAYAFTLRQVEEDLEQPATDLHAMVREAVAAITSSEEKMSRMGLPRAHWDYIAQSWQKGEPEVYGRMDMAYDGSSPAKLLEYNADTPTSLFESCSFQWDWLTDQTSAGVLPEGADQFNRVYEAISERFAEIFEAGTHLHFASVEGNEEDYGTVETLAYAARDAQMGAHFTTIQSIGLTDRGQFADAEGRVMGALFKLYPWEDLLNEPFAQHIAGSGLRFIEPAWKALVSNKAILPVLWDMFEGHPNLLPAFFMDDVATNSSIMSRAEAAFGNGYVKKPLFSREGASIDIYGPNGETIALAKNRAYDAHPQILQAYHPLPNYEGMRPVLGLWVAGRECVGLGMREDASLITEDLSRFKPHYILD